jgi:hypothetical protein
MIAFLILAGRGVMGNTDEILVQPQSLEKFANQSSVPAALRAAIRQMASAPRASHGRTLLFGDF